MSSTTSDPRSRRVIAIAAVVVSPIAAVPAAATSVAATPPVAGFGTPVARSPATGAVDSPVTAVAPNGRTAVMWRQFGPRARDFGYVAALGPSPARLGRSAVVRAGSRSARSVAGVQLVPLPNGGFAACFGDDERRGEAVVGCAFAPPHGGFGPLRVVARAPWKRRPGFAAAALPDGRLALVVSRRTGHADGKTLRTAVLDATGRLTGAQGLGTVRTNAPYDIATTTDGTVAVSWSTGPAGYVEGGRTPVLRLRPPGADRFGTPVAFSPERTIDGGVDLHGGRELLLGYEVGLGSGDGATRIVRRLPDGTFTAPLLVPRSGDGFVEAAVVPLADGTPFAVTSTQDSDQTDCGGIVRGAVGAGPLVPPAAPEVGQRLSAPSQIATDPRAVALEDGTVVAAWQDAAGRSGAGRVEATVRPAGETAFRRPQVLPRISARDLAIAGGGNQAILVWTVGALPDGPSHVVTSALRRAAPFAPAAPRPRHSVAPCG